MALSFLDWSVKLRSSQQRFRISSPFAFVISELPAFTKFLIAVVCYYPFFSPKLLILQKLKNIPNKKLASLVQIVFQVINS